MPTPHNEATNGQIAKTVLMPGDPLRAKFIAEHYLTEVQLVSAVRNMYCYTGSYQGTPVSVMGSGMGMPSMGIYSYELFTVYGVENILRVGSAGSYNADVKVLDVVVADSAYSESTFAKTQNGYESEFNFPSKTLTKALTDTAARLKIPVHRGCVHSSDVFYRSGKANYFKTLVKEKGCLCVEMESFALFHNAVALHKNAACLLTVSDSLVEKIELSAKERETSFDKMIKIALDTAVTLY